MQNRPWPQKLAGPTRDIEQGASGDLQHLPASVWQKPTTWKEAEEKRSFEDCERMGSVNSETTLQPVLPARS